MPSRWALYMADKVEPQWSYADATFKARRESMDREQFLRARDPLAVLGLPSDATSQQIDRRAREELKRHHPDTAGGTEASARFHDVVWAMKKLRERKEDT